MRHKKPCTIKEFIDPPDALTNLFCKNGGEILIQRYEHDNQGNVYRFITFKIPILWETSIFYPLETVHPSLQPFLDPESNEQLRYIVPDDPNRMIYGVFFTGQRIDIRPIHML